MDKFVGTKTTVHFSDGVLFPTYTEYHCPGADVILSLFSDRFMVAGSYVILRVEADLQYRLTMRFLKDPKLIWIEKCEMERLKKLIGLSGVKHPTSGMLAIDYFVNKPGVKLPVHIHGFDFFQDPTIHYYNDVEPLCERINNRIGVNMHSPHLEKIYVEKFVQELYAPRSSSACPRWLVTPVDAGHAASHGFLQSCHSLSFSRRLGRVEEAKVPNQLGWWLTPSGRGPPPPRQRTCAQADNTEL